MDRADHKGGLVHMKRIKNENGTKINGLSLAKVKPDQLHGLLVHPTHYPALFATAHVMSGRRYLRDFCLTSEDAFAGSERLPHLEQWDCKCHKWCEAHAQHLVES